MPQRRLLRHPFHMFFVWMFWMTLLSLPIHANASATSPHVQIATRVQTSKTSTPPTSPQLSWTTQSLSWLRVPNKVQTQWIRFRVTLPQTLQTPDWMMVVRPIDFVAVDVYLPKGKKAAKAPQQWSKRSYGIYNTHTLLQHLVFPFQAQPRKTYTFYLRVQTGGATGRHGYINLSAHPASQWLKNNDAALLFCGVYYGLVAGLVVVHFFLFLWLRDIAALWFVLYHIAFVVFLLGSNQLLPLLLRPWSPPPELLFRIQEFALGLYILGSIVYTRIFLQTRDSIPRWDRVILGYTGLTCAFLLMVPWANLPTLAQTAQTLGMLAPFVTVVPGVLRWRQGFPPALIYVGAWGVFSLAAFAFASPLLGAWGAVVFQVGSGLSAVLLSLAMVQRIRLLQDEQTRTSATMQQAEKMATLGQLVAGVAHEINNPNNFITFNLPILRRYVEAMEPHIQAAQEEQPNLKILRMPVEEFVDDTYKLLDTMEHGTQRITAIVNDLRSYVRSQDATEPEAVSMEETVQRTLSLMGRQLEKHVTQLEVSLEDNLPILSLHPGRLEQVLINLLLNATQAMSEQDDSVLRLEAKTSTKDPGWVEVGVHDNGPGIPKELQSQIFAPFFTTKGRESSMGLGLSISQRLVEAEGGRLTLHSKEGEGASFLIHLPIPKDHP
ncbi:MAG: hypothetical protein EP343_00405 [Deltaproteobacteria bacterium]|nr:MAG: hypothetical protein EP343_00405 [Deltaproteobacteria bacterium]